VIVSLDRNRRRYFAMYGLVMGGYFGITGVLLNLYLLRLGFDSGFIGLINGLSLASSAAVSTPAGALGRRFGSRSTILLGLLLSGAGAAVIPAAGSLPASLVAAGIVCGSLVFFSGGALYAANWAPYLMEISAQDERPRMFSLRAAVQPLATFVGSLAAGVLPRGVSGVVGRPLSDPLPYRLAFPSC
jgi:MFS family permease